VNSRDSANNLDDDDIFLDKLVSGDEEAFRKLVSRHSQIVYNISLRMVRDRELAEDLTQEVFVKVYKALPRFRRRSKLSTWLYRIAYNTAMTELERARYRYEMDDVEDERLQGKLDSAREFNDNILDKLERDELAARVESLIEKLNPEQRMVMTLYYNGEKSYKEISEIMGLPMGTVKTLLFRAKAGLRAMLIDGEEK
jgi:RNA polymerase sigma-70 factor (ECF subfamily)